MALSMAWPPSPGGWSARPRPRSFPKGPFVHVPLGVDHPHRGGRHRDVVDVGHLAGDAAIVESDDSVDAVEPFSDVSLAWGSDAPGADVGWVPAGLALWE
jgi:hypothetical protein